MFQAFDDDALAFLGRRHTGAQATAAVTMALEAGFETVSFDLIYGLPNQDLDEWGSTLEHAISLAPEHLSCYQLTIEPGTPFGQQRTRGDLTPVSNDDQGAFFMATHETLAKGGFEGYEVSNFAKASRYRSAHNQKYWHHVPYLGLGPAAHSFDGQDRWWNERHLARYGRQLRGGRSAVVERERPNAEQRALERLMLGLRTAEGLSHADFRKRYGVDLIAGNEQRIERMQQSGLLYGDTTRLRLTLEGRAVVESVVAEWALGETAR